MSRLVNSALLGGALLLEPAALQAAEDDAPVAVLAQQLGAAIAKRDAALAQAQFTPAAWARSGDSGESLYAQGVGKHFELRQSKLERKGDRAVITVEIWAAGKAVDRVYLYALQQAGRWQIDGLDENLTICRSVMAKQPTEPHPPCTMMSEPVRPCARSNRLG